ncbi:hypothetical protein N5E99_10640 [Pseudomonas chengduensis]|jgi:hypothetical protein|uniref:Uncharacterized protein n=1 Tax=Ectopseudomonas chengduensis TaxID=489632 RepID=A0A1G6V3R4_9GAMM|nr:MULTISPECIES: hypothetical protein [Pseudomonas]KQO31002.1 hypothetical protein ASF15_10170 [Pseudomonas sp. Leaf83]MBP3063885.1 hypothetical protein [Pseudomonas chengduensis]MDH0959230.1 hypothetical protein [Pseudomonas chengduensis]MDH1536208.1 hypothetical protein [Pseudomonas chengduensis]MDH1623710.1 hypothetical protein [Pseudomonas chengduensis]
MGYLEPLYLNEKMVLNAAAYLFKGVGSELEERVSSSANSQANAKIGISFLQGLLGKAELGVKGESASASEVTTVKRYTLGGLHMTVVDELENRKDIKDFSNVEMAAGQYIKAKAVLQPVDIFQLVETLQTSAPLIVQGLKHFGVGLGIQKKSLDEFLKYEKPLTQLIDAIEQDYLKSKQLEMLLCSPETGIPFGVVDLDVTDYDPKEIKAKLTDGEFAVFGKLTKRIGGGETLSLVQRTFLSYVMGVLDTLMEVTNDMKGLNEYRHSMDTAKPFVERFCRLSIDGPAYRMTAMSVCA